MIIIDSTLPTSQLLGVNINPAAVRTNAVNPQPIINITNVLLDQNLNPASLSMANYALSLSGGAQATILLPNVISIGTNFVTNVYTVNGFSFTNVTAAAITNVIPVQLTQGTPDGTVSLVVPATVISDLAGKSGCSGNHCGVPDSQHWTDGHVCSVNVVCKNRDRSASRSRTPI